MSYAQEYLSCRRRVVLTLIGPSITPNVEVRHIPDRYRNAGTVSLDDSRRADFRYDSRFCTDTPLDGVRLVTIAVIWAMSCNM